MFVLQVSAVPFTSCLDSHTQNNSSMHHDMSNMSMDMEEMDCCNDECECECESGLCVSKVFIQGATVAIKFSTSNSYSYYIQPASIKHHNSSIYRPPIFS